MNLKNIFSNPIFKPVSQLVNRFLAYWRDLSLARKLLMAFAALAFLTLLVGVTANIGLNNVQNSYERALSEGNAMEKASLLLSNNLLNAEQNEKDFLLRWQTDGYDSAYENYVTKNQNSVAAMRDQTKKLSAFAPVVGQELANTYPAWRYSFDLGELNRNIDLYDQNFQNVVKAIKERGFQDTGLVGKFSIAADSLEKRINASKGLDPFTISGAPQDLQIEARNNYQKELNAMVITMLQIRRYEGIYFETGDQKSIDAVHQQVADLKQQIATSQYLNDADKNQWRDLSDRYLVAFEAVVAKDVQITTSLHGSRITVLAMEPLVNKITNTGAELSRLDVAKAKATNSRVLVFSIITPLVVLGLAIFLAVALSRQITQPVYMLIQAVQELEAGNYDVHANVSSGDEIGTLANAFNSMSERLKTTLARLARRTQMLSISTDVSRRLSSLLTQEELIKEVVEQVQSSFNYYHVHIYFRDEESGDLIMAGGTGTVSQVMMTNGHKVLRGKGLVGRAAETKVPVVVSDTLSDPNWLPNRLLPETKAEVAVPILIGGKLLGVLDVQHNVTGGLNQDDADLLLSVANQFAIAMRNARSYTEVQARAEREALIASIGQKIQNTSTVEGTLQVAVREIGRALGVQHTRVMLNLAKNKERNS